MQVHKGFFSEKNFIYVGMTNGFIIQQPDDAKRFFFGVRLTDLFVEHLLPFISQRHFGEINSHSDEECGVRLEPVITEWFDVAVPEFSY